MEQYNFIIELEIVNKKTKEIRVAKIRHSCPGLKELDEWLKKEYPKNKVISIIGG